MAVVINYCQSLLQEGVLEDTRGRMQAVETDAPHHYSMIGGATLAGAFYMACEQDPSNEHVKRIISEGFSGVNIWIKSMPPDSIEWFKNEANRWHRGSAFNLVEMLMEIPKAEAQWAAHRTKHNITVRSCPSSGEFRYEKVYE
eukprot:7470981-Pyramimonas_sp.AAC.1